MRSVVSGTKPSPLQGGGWDSCTLQPWEGFWAGGCPGSMEPGGAEWYCWGVGAQQVPLGPWAWAWDLSSSSLLRYGCVTWIRWLQEEGASWSSWNRETSAASVCTAPLPCSGQPKFTAASIYGAFAGCQTLKIQSRRDTNIECTNIKWPEDLRREKLSEHTGEWEIPKEVAFGCDVKDGT